jgi:putative ABC transport system ATP-binding protein
VTDARRPPALTLTDVGVVVPDGDDTLTILDGCSLEVRPAEVVAVTGRSGSGKSTLLAVAGLLRTPQQGTVHVDGHDTTQLSRRAHARLRRDAIGFVHQSSQLFPSLRAVEQLELVAHIAGELDRDARRRARERLDEVGLTHRAEHRPAHLSGGERQRLEIARALMRSLSVLLADEPTAALDPDRARDIMTLLADETRRHGVATVVVVHDPTNLDLADRRLELRDGRLHDAGQPVG